MGTDAHGGAEWGRCVEGGGASPVRFRAQKPREGRLRVVQIDDEVEALLGVSPRELVVGARPLRSFVSPADERRLRAEQLRAAGAADAFDAVLTVFGRRGRRERVRLHVEPPTQLIDGTRIFEGTLTPAEDGARSTVSPRLVRSGHPDAQTVLLVEDSAPLRGLLASVLREAGHVVHDTEHGLHALELLAADPSISLLVTDHAMPELSGPTLVRAARVARPGLRVLVISGHAELEGCFDEPAEHLAKPFDADVFLARVAGR